MAVMFVRGYRGITISTVPWSGFKPPWTAGAGVEAAGAGGAASSGVVELMVTFRDEGGRHNGFNSSRKCENEPKTVP